MGELDLCMGGSPWALGSESGLRPTPPGLAARLVQAESARTRLCDLCSRRTPGSGVWGAGGVTAEAL